ncbi:hypothetical protein V494_02208 [Pseudogymnoascus sp. VKM F-4513 (FW-928)]|nr:hypothetical protein V494_02208 [Pseudogymnoascus sp. VKM F-4513 (FW-928)]
MSLSKTNSLELQFSLRQAVINCSERCQYQSAKWAAELLDALPDDDELDPEVTSLTEVFNTQTDPVEMRLERNELPKYLMAKALLDCREARRCAAVYLSTDSSEHAIPLQNNVLNVSHGKLCGSVFRKTSQKGLFLASYALLLTGEKEKTEELGPILGPSDTGAVVNKQIVPLRRMLETWFDQEAENRRSQGWLEYLYGIVLAKDRSNDLAIDWLLKSILLYPWNWGAWLELSGLIRDVHHLNQIQSKLQPHVMAFIFSVHCRQELHQSSPALLSEISQLQSVFPRSLFLKSQQALVFYRMKDFHTANTLFSEMLFSDPFRLDFLDDHSSALHNLGSYYHLAFVTHLASSISRYRPETQVALGSYYSAFSRHSDAIQAFRMALNLDRNFAAAWTLLGDEYYKVENTHSAIEAYRRAVEGNNKDYHAYVGLGFVYEKPEKRSYALHYYKSAAALSPADAEVWGKMGLCLVGMKRYPQAIEVLKRGISRSDYWVGNGPDDEFHAKCRRVDMLFQLARAYEKMENREEAIKYMRICREEYTGKESHGNMDDPLRVKVSLLLGLSIRPIQVATDGPTSPTVSVILTALTES